MLFENQPKNIESLIAKSADLANKPFIHSVRYCPKHNLKAPHHSDIL